MTDNLFPYLSQSPTAYHAATTTAAELTDAGFSELSTRERFPTPIPSRFFLRTGGALFAIDASGSFVDSGVTILAAHTDSPSLKVKMHSVETQKGVVVAPTEVYGGPIRASWLDQPLGVGGVAYLASGSKREFRLKESVLIPNIAIHLNRKLNEGYEYNPQDHLTAVIGEAPSGDSDSADQRLLSEIAVELGTSPEQIAEVDAYLFDAAEPQKVGLDQAFYLSPRIDNLAGCFANLQAFLSAPRERPRMLALYNHEEIGSRSAEGALSGVILSLLERTWNALALDPEDREVARNRSLLVSNDATHAMHPNFASSYDKHYSCVLNGGPVIKYSASYRYATTGESAALFARACAAAEVPVQRFVTRSDMRSGSTVGPLGWAQTGMQSVDVGMPIWAMHSIRETGGVRDVELMVRALAAVLSRSE